LTNVRSSEQDSSPLDGDSPQVDERHRWVVRLALDGHSSPDIARHLDLPHETVVQLLLDVLKHIGGAGRH